MLAADCLKMPRGEAFEEAFEAGKFPSTFLQTIYDTSKILGHSLENFDQVCLTCMHCLHRHVNMPLYCH